MEPGWGPGAAVAAFTYSAYGLRFQLPLACPELRSDDGPEAPDVVGLFGRIETDPADVSGGAVFHATPDQLLLALPEIARFLVSNGRRIVIQPEPGVAESTLRLFMLGSCFGAILQQRGLLTLHASAIATAGGAVLFAGEPGAGKSTLLAEFRRRGARMIADDVVAVRVDGPAAFWVLPGYPHAKLWADSMEMFKEDPTVLHRVRPEIEKFGVPVTSHFVTGEVPLAQIFLLVPTSDTSPRVERIQYMQAFHSMLGITYRREFLAGFGRLARHFEMTAEIARAVPVTRIARPAHALPPEFLADLVEEYLG